MATGGDPPDRDSLHQDFRHSCSLCLEPYRGRNPKILPCFHTFCLPCLTALETNAAQGQGHSQGQGQDELEKEANVTEGQGDPQGQEGLSEGQGQVEEAAGRDDTERDDATSPSDDVVAKKVFLCPTCRTQITIPEDGVAALQTNFYLDCEEADRYLNQLLCDMCDVGNKQKATHSCQQCQLRMCKSCRRHHDMFTRDHHVTPLEFDQSAKGKEEKGCCLFHRDQPLRYFCRQCEIAICLKCKAKSHDGHVTIDMDQAAVESREEVTSLATTAVEQLQVVQSSVRRLERAEDELSRYTSSVKQQVQDRYDALMTWAQRSRDEVMRDITSKDDETRQQLQSEKAEATVTMETLSTLVARASRATANSPDVVWLRKEFEAALLGHDRLSHLRELADPEQPVLKWNYYVSGADVVDRDLLAVYMGRVADGAAAEVQKPLSLKDVSEEVDRLMSEKADSTTVSDNMKKVSDSVKQLSDKVDRIGTDTTALTKKLDKAGKMVSFFAKGGKKIRFGSPMKFREVVFNEGNCFDQDTGMFTTPVPGTYTFTASVRCSKDSSASACIRVDGTAYTYVSGCNKSTGCGAISLLLRADQTVCLKCSYDSEECFEPNELYFSGALVQPQL